MSKQASKKHVMLSYQWKVQDLATSVYEYLAEKKVPVWIDIKSGLSSKNLYDGLSDAIENSSCFVCFMSPEYQGSDFCKQEFQYATKCHIPIIPLKLDDKWEPTSWLGLQTVGLVWLDFYRTTDFKIKASQLHSRICAAVDDLYQQPKSKHSSRKTNETGSQPQVRSSIKPTENEVVSYKPHLKIKGAPFCNRSSHPNAIDDPTKPCKFGQACYDYSDAHRAHCSHSSSTDNVTELSKTPMACWYGSKCYDNSDSHRAQFTHSSGCEDDSPLHKASRACRYGSNCFDKSDSHRAQFSHSSSAEDGNQLIKTSKACRYGSKCFDESDLHRAQFTHSSGCEDDSPLHKAPRACRYGSNCFDKSDSHRAQFSHSSSVEDDDLSITKPEPCKPSTTGRSKFRN